MSGIARSAVDDMMALILARPFKPYPSSYSSWRRNHGPFAFRPGSAEPRLAEAGRCPRPGSWPL
jgi:hypothetical protein